MWKDQYILDGLWETGLEFQMVGMLFEWGR